MTDKKQQRRERIIKSAEERFFSDGFHKVSLDDLVADLRISKSTIYEFFGSKDGLVREIVIALSDRLESRLAEISADTAHSVHERLLAIAEFQGTVARNLSERFMTDLRVHQPELWDLFQQRREQRIDRFYRKLIEEGAAAGLFAAGYDKEFLLRLYLKMSEIVSYTDIMDHIPMTKQQAYTTIIEVFIRGTKA